MEYHIKKVTADVFGMNEDNVSLSHRLMGGMSNLMYVVKVQDDFYTFRIPGKNAEVFVDRLEEKANIDIVEPLTLNNHTVYFDVQTGYKIAKYIEGVPISELADKEQYLPDIADALKKLHGSGLKAEKDYHPYRRLEKYEVLVGEHSERYFKLKELCFRYRPLLDGNEKVICHNDSQLSNFVLAEKKLYLLDWEFAGQNDPLYDVACVGNQDFTLAEKLLPIYLGYEPRHSEWVRLYAWRAFQCLQWHNVARYKESIGLSADLGIDFKIVADMYLDKAEKFLKNASQWTDTNMDCQTVA